MGTQIGQGMDPDGSEECKDNQTNDAKPINEQKKTGPQSAVTRCSLPLELNVEIFKCLTLPIQRKFIWGLGKGIYAVFRQKHLSKTTRIRNPNPNNWKQTNTKASISPNGLQASMDHDSALHYVFAEKGFDIADCRQDLFPGTIINYFEVTITRIASKWFLFVGLSNGNISDDQVAKDSPHCHGIYDRDWDDYLHNGQRHRFELPNGAIRPKWKARLPFELATDPNRPEWNYHGDVIGCGLLLDSENKLAIFFTLNGVLRGKKIPISPVENCLFPTIKICGDICLEANFGDDPTKPFIFDILKCPELNFFQIEVGK